MGDRGISIVHAVPGRIRLKISRLKRDPKYAVAIRDRLLTLPGVRRVEANPLTASVVVSYNDPATTLPALVPNLSEALQQFASPDLDRKEIEAILTSPSNGNGSHPPATPLATRINSWLGTMDESVDWVTGGNIDLRVLLPLSLFVLGIGRLLSSGNVQSPTWFDFLWFSFGTFVALNAGRVAQAGQPP
jgi:hypothetical protein